MKLMGICFVVSLFLILLTAEPVGKGWELIVGALLAMIFQIGLIEVIFILARIPYEKFFKRIWGKFK
jgi:hypothetical protein